MIAAADRDEWLASSYDGVSQELPVPDEQEGLNVELNRHRQHSVRFQVLTTASMKMISLHSAIYQKATIFRQSTTSLPVLHKTTRQIYL
jgi:hypothetical protein